jgi:DedD protein
LLFETQPRPIPVDIPIEIPKKDGAPPLVMPAARPKPVAVLPAEPASAAAPAEVITETRADVGRDVTAAAPKPPEPVVAKPASAAAPTLAAAPKPAPAASAKQAPAASANDSARAQALLEGRPAAKDGARYVVQVGAFADSAAARETRAKVEKLGLKTYTQVADTASGSRIRVRIGPFASRDEADRAMAKAKAAGVAAVVLTL